MTTWLTPQQVADVTQRHVVTVWRALERGELHGHQPRRGGRWRIDAAAADAWARGQDSRQPCCAPVVSLGSRRSA